MPRREHTGRSRGAGLGRGARWLGPVALRSGLALALVTTPVAAAPAATEAEPAASDTATTTAAPETAAATPTAPEPAQTTPERPSAPAAEPRRNESGAERLHRKGVHCMEEIERPQCAIEQFEALLREDTRQRELITDGMLRLLILYRRTEQPERVGPLLRRFWEAGGDRRSRGHLPYSARFMPADLNMLLNVDPPRLLSSSLFVRRDPDLRDYIFSCDPVRKREIEDKYRWRRAVKRAAEQGRTPGEMLYEELDEEAAKRAEHEKRRAQYEAEHPDRPTAEERDRPPLVMAMSCPLVEALDLRDNAQWRRMTGALHHRERDKSVAIYQLDDLQAHLDAAVAEGRLVADGPNRWRLPDFDYGNQTIRLASLDLDELVAAPQAILHEMTQARRKRKRRLNGELDGLVAQVPKDTAAFMVLNQAALRELGFGGMQKRSLRSVIEAILPRPKGLQMAAIAGDSLGLFTRVPTDSAVRGRMLINIANAFLARTAADDEELAEWMESLDLAEAGDRKALLLSFLISGAKLEEILWD